MYRPPAQCITLLVPREQPRIQARRLCRFKDIAHAAARERYGLWECYSHRCGDDSVPNSESYDLHPNTDYGYLDDVGIVSRSRSRNAYRPGV